MKYFFAKLQQKFAKVIKMLYLCTRFAFIRHVDTLSLSLGAMFGLL